MSTAASGAPAPKPGRFLRRLAPRLKPYVGYLSITAVLIVIGTAIGLAFPMIVRNLLDAAFLEGSSRLLNFIALGLCLSVARRERQGLIR